MPASSRSVIGIALRRWLLAVLLLAAPLLAVIITFYRQDRTHERELLRQRAADSLDLASEKIERELQLVKSDVLYLSRQTALAKFLAAEEGSRELLEREYHTFAQEKATFDQIRLLDLEGNEVIRINYQGGEPVVVPKDELQPKSTRYYFQQAVDLPRGEVFISRMDLNEEHEAIQIPYKPVIRFVTPVYSDDGVRSGYLVLNYLGQNLLTEFAETTRGLPGAKYVANGQGDFLDSPDPNDNWGWLLGHSQSLATKFPEFWPLGPRRQNQLPGEQGLFSAVQLKLGGKVPATAGAQKSVVPENETKLLLISFVPWPEIDSRSQLLLQRLIATAAGAFILLGVLAGYWAHASAIRLQQGKQLADSEARLRVLSRQLLHAQEEERRRISRDLHDDLSQQITAISLNLQSAQRQQSPAVAMDLINKGIESAQQLLASVHHIAGNLRPSVLDDLAFVAAIESLVAELEGIYSVNIASQIADLHELELPGEVKENAYRIIQEGLSNAARHSASHDISLKISFAAGILSITIRDRGQGFVVEEADATRLGLLGMRERAELLGGTFQLHSQPGSGTTIELKLPTETLASDDSARVAE